LVKKSFVIYKTRVNLIPTLLSRKKAEQATEKELEDLSEKRFIINEFSFALNYR
jgi:hypothetical protein